MTKASVAAERDRASAVAAAAFDADPYLTGTTADAVTALRQYWAKRLADVRVEVP